MLSMFKWSLYHQSMRINVSVIVAVVPRCKSSNSIYSDVIEYNNIFCDCSFLGAVCFVFCIRAIKVKSKRHGYD